jgi:SAM-dependent methyltransferase
MTSQLYSLPFTPGTRVLELGGGDQPMIRPNMDSRRLPTVDIVHSLEDLPYPFPDNLCDGVLLKFAAEHVSWKRVQSLCDELYRITAPGGVVVLIVPNTLEQCKRIVAEGEFTQDTECMLFGGQGYPEDTHKNAWSPKLAQDRLFKAGFCNVRTFPWPQAVTDMVVEARKSKAEVLFS